LHPSRPRRFGHCQRTQRHRQDTWKSGRSMCRRRCHSSSPSASHSHGEGQLQARVRALEQLGIAFGENALEIASEQWIRWAYRIDVLLQHEVLRALRCRLQLFLHLLWRQGESLFRLLRIPNFVWALVVVQASWYEHHSEHPPHGRTPLTVACGFHAGPFAT
jgi:hypothetical protein